MTRRPLAFALLFAMLPAVAPAADLLQVYQLAREGDPQLSASESRRLQIREGAVQARAAMLPQIGGQASYTRSTSDSSGAQVFGGTLFNNNTSQDSSTRDVGLTVDQMIYDRSRFTRLRSQRELGRSSDYQVEAAGDSLITRTSAAYFNVLVQLETLAAARASETALKKQFDFASKRLEVGLAPITDVHEARARFDSARASTILAQNAVADAYQALVEITGVRVDSLKALPADFQPALPATRDAESWVATATGNNPALHAKEAQLAAAEADVETARAGHWPTLSAGGTFGDRRTNGTSTNNLTSAMTAFENQSRSRSLGITLRVPIYAGGAVQSGVRAALAQRDVTADELEQQRRALVRNTRNAYQGLVAGISEVEARRLALVSARSAYDASQVGLEVGTRTVLDVLNNQQSLFNAQQAYAQSRYNFLQSRLLLEQAAGTLDVDDVQDVNRLLTVNAPAP